MMKKVLLLGVVVLLVMTIFSGCIGQEQLKAIEKTIDIKATDGTAGGTALDVHEGVYGTLTINGEIISSDTDVAYIHLTWEADTEFPTDYAIGSITVGDFHEYPIGLNPLWHGLDYLGWSGAEGENHIWKMDLKFHRDVTIVRHYADNLLIKTKQYQGGYITLITGFTSSTDTREQVHICGAFTVRQQSGSYEHANHIPTFYLIKDNDDFYFSHNAIFVEY